MQRAACLIVVAYIVGGGVGLYSTFFCSPHWLAHSCVVARGRYLLTASSGVEPALHQNEILYEDVYF